MVEEPGLHKAKVLLVESELTKLTVQFKSLPPFQIKQHKLDYLLSQNIVCRKFN